MSELTNVSTQYDFIEILQKIGSNFFGEDLSQERIGMFGFMAESFAHMYGALALDSNMRSKEYNVSTAMKRETLQYAAYRLGIEYPNAYPANMNAYIGIKETDILTYGTKVSDSPKTYKMVLENNINVNVGGFNFRPEYDIEITATYSSASNQYYYKAKYLGYGDVDVTSDYTYQDSKVCDNIKDKEVPCLRTGDTTKLIIVRVDLKQLYKKTHEYVVTDTETINLRGLDFDYTNQLSYFNIYYKAADSDEYVYMKAVSKHDKDSYEENVIYYEQLDDDHKLRFDFDKFGPTYNSIIKIDIFSTSGTEANNLVYVGDGSDITTKISSDYNRHNYAGVNLTCTPIETNDDGVDTLTIDELREYIINRSSNLNAIVTDRDIVYYLESIDKYNSYYANKVRSDVISMIYEISALVKDSDGGIISTLTTNVNFPAMSGVTYKILPSGTPISEGSNYVTPYDITVIVDGTRFDIDSYASCIKRNANMNLSDTKPGSVNFKMDHISIERNIQKHTSNYGTSDSEDDYYTIKVSVLPDGDISKAISGTDINTGAVKDAIMLRGFTYSDIKNHTVSGVFKFNFESYSDGIFTFASALKVYPFIDTEHGNALKLKLLNTVNVNNVNKGNSVVNVDGEYIVDGELPWQREASTIVTIPVEDFVFGIGCYYLDYDKEKESSTVPGTTSEFQYISGTRLCCNYQGGDTTKPIVAHYTSADGSLHQIPKYWGLVSYSDGADNVQYTPCDVYQNSTDSIDLYVDMWGIIKIDYTETTSNNVASPDKLVDIPAVIYTEMNNERFRSTIFDTKDYLELLRSKLLNNFETSFKFHNTSGQSNYFKLCSYKDQNFITVSDLALNLVLDVVLTDEYSSLDTEITNSIKHDIKFAIESACTNIIDTTDRVYLNNLIHNVAASYSTYIRYMELNTINGSDGHKYNYIKYVKPSSVGSSYIPEGISVPLSNISLTLH